MSSAINHKKRSSRKSHNKIPVNMFIFHANKAAEAKYIRQITEAMREKKKEKNESVAE